MVILKIFAVVEILKVSVLQQLNVMSMKVKSPLVNLIIIPYYYTFYVPKVAHCHVQIYHITFNMYSDINCNNCKMRFFRLIRYLFF